MQDGDWTPEPARVRGGWWETSARLGLLLSVGCRPAPEAPSARPLAPTLPQPDARVAQTPDVAGPHAPLEHKCEGMRLDLDWVVHADHCSQAEATITELPVRLEPETFTLLGGDRETVELVVANDTAVSQTYVVKYCAFRDGLELAITDDAGHSVDTPGPCGSGRSCGGPPVAFTLAPGGTARWAVEFAAVARIEDDKCEVVVLEPLGQGRYDLTVSWYRKQSLTAELRVP